MSTAIERIFREEFGRVVASLTRRFGDLDVAEEAAGEALLAALERWPVDGVPPNPGGWLTTTATRRATGPDPSRAATRRQAPGGPDDPRRHAPRADRRRRRRPAPADLHLLPSRAGARGPGGTHPAAARRAHRRRDRGGVPGPGDDDGPAHHPGQGQDQGRAHPVPRAVGRRPRRAARRRADRGLPRLQRGLPGQRGRRPGPRRADRRGDPARPGAARRCCPPSPRSRACSR